MTETRRDLPRDPLRCVLVTTDFSQGATLAIRRALRLPLAARAKVLLLHVGSADEAPATRRKPIAAEARRKLSQALATARRQAKSIGRADLEVRADLVSGQPFVEIIRRSRSTSSDLIVIGRHGRHPIRDMLIGSTAERVVRKGDVPVLVVNAAARKPYARPMIASDLRDASSRLLELALRVLEPSVKTVAVVHAFHVAFETRLGAGYSEAATAYRRHVKQEANHGLNQLIATWRDDTDLQFTPVLKKGDPRLVVPIEVERRHTDLLILGTHARSGLARALIGSVADFVVKAVSCDVLVTRPVRFSFGLP